MAQGPEFMHSCQNSACDTSGLEPAINYLISIECVT